MVEILHGDCLDLLKEIEDNSVDAIVTDPPYHLVQNSRNGSPHTGDLSTPHGRTGPSKMRSGFMGTVWDGGDISFRPDVWLECLRVLKPGGHMAVFGGSRTHHRIWCAIEDVGFEVRDTIMWIYGQGFPKSLDISKAIDKHFGLLGDRGEGFNVAGQNVGLNQNQELRSDHPEYKAYVPSSPEAQQWDGWGTAIKPAFEPILLARKPLSEKTVVKNVLRWGTGAINVDACRVSTYEAISNHSRSSCSAISKGIYGDSAAQETHQTTSQKLGRYPANVCHDGSDEVLEAFPMTTKAGNTKPQPASPGTSMFGIGEHAHNPKILGDNGGSAARFFYAAKASKSDRAGSRHPTVKPIKLMQWLTSLITPPEGVVLDPFAGSGTIGAAALAGGFGAILIEREQEYIEDIKRRFVL